MKFKQLSWQQHDELNGIYAEPYGLKWCYSIYIDKQGSIKFGLLDPFYEYVPEFTRICNTIEEAKQYAQKHYQTIIKMHKAMH